MNFLFRVLSYFKYLVFSGNAHSIHSPFVFELYTKVICTTKKYYCFRNIEQLRNQLLEDSRTIDIKDFGTGKNKLNTNRAVQDIAARSVKSKPLARLLFRLVAALKPLTIVELGTSLGITTAYLASMNSNSKVITFEGCPTISQIARSNFHKLNIHNITLHTGNIDQTLEATIQSIDKIDFAFVDANHTYEATLLYFDILQKYMNVGAAIVFDDIHWSLPMQKAWKEIIAKPQVTISIDLFDIGIVFLTKDQPKQHFILRK